MTRFAAFLLAMTLLFLGSSASGEEGPEWKAKLNDLVNPLLSKKKLRNLVIGVIDSSGKRHYLTFGEKPEGFEKLDENTIFEVGSITKTFTSLILADAVLKGEVALDEPVQKYLPKRWRYRGEATRRLRWKSWLRTHPACPRCRRTF